MTDAFTPAADDHECDDPYCPVHGTESPTIEAALRRRWAEVRAEYIGNPRAKLELAEQTDRAVEVLCTFARQADVQNAIDKQPDAYTACVAFTPSLVTSLREMVEQQIRRLRMHSVTSVLEQLKALTGADDTASSVRELLHRIAENSEVHEVTSGDDVRTLMSDDDADPEQREKLEQIAQQVDEAPTNVPKFAAKIDLSNTPTHPWAELFHSFDTAWNDAFSAINVISELPPYVESRDEIKAAHGPRKNIHFPKAMLLLTYGWCIATDYITHDARGTCISPVITYHMLFGNLDTATASEVVHKTARLDRKATWHYMQELGVPTEVLELARAVVFSDDEDGESEASPAEGTPNDDWLNFEHSGHAH